MVVLFCVTLYSQNTYNGLYKKVVGDSVVYFATEIVNVKGKMIAEHIQISENTYFTTLYKFDIETEDGNSYIDVYKKVVGDSILYFAKYVTYNSDTILRNSQISEFAYAKANKTKLITAQNRKPSPITLVLLGAFALVLGLYMLQKHITKTYSSPY